MKPSTALELHRDAIVEVVANAGCSSPRIFGSVLHGTDTEESDLDLLVEPGPETTMFDIGKIMHELQNLLGVKVDVLTPNALPDSFRARVLSEARPVIVRPELFKQKRLGFLAGQFKTPDNFDSLGYEEIAERFQK